MTCYLYLHCKIIELFRFGKRCYDFTCPNNLLVKGARNFEIKRINKNRFPLKLFMSKHY